MIIADDHVLTANSLFAVIRDHRPQYELVGRAGTAEEAVALCRKVRPDLLLLDTTISGQSEIKIVPQVKQFSPGTRILLYCPTANQHEILAGIRAGADGFLEKTCSEFDFFEALDRVTNGENYLCRKTLAKLLSALRSVVTSETRDPGELTRREREVLELLAAGETSKTVAKKLFIGVSTVESHRANLMEKLGVRNVAELVQHAFKRGLLPGAP